MSSTIPMAEATSITMLTGAIAVKQRVSQIKMAQDLNIDLF